MARYIDYDRMVDFVSACGLNTKLFEMKHKDEVIEDVAPIIHAKWEICSPKNSFQKIRCTNCKTPSDCIRKYCPECGAKMDKE